MKKLTIFALGAFLVLFLFISARPTFAFDSPVVGPEPPVPGDEDTLQVFLLWVIGGGGAAVAAYWVLNKSKRFEDLPKEHKRYVSLAVMALFAVLAYLAAAGLNYVEAPTTAQGWLEKLTSIAYAATAGALTIHGWCQLRGGE